MVGYRLARRRWGLVAGYAGPLAVLLAVAATRMFVVLEFTWPFRWLVAGRREFALTGPVICCVVTVLMARMPRRRVRVLLAAMAAVATWRMAICPYVMPLAYRSETAQLEELRIGGGMCLQSTSYTCGPAAAVTALGQLGITAGEGELAVLAYTVPHEGTAGDLLRDAIIELGKDYGVTAEYRAFADLEELRKAGLTIVQVKFRPMLDHYVTVLEVKSDTVELVDPLAGRESWSHEEFLGWWRFVGIVVKRAGQ
jgi:hypothetical protein